MFPSLEGTHPLEKGCSQAALQTAAASEGPWCFAVGCAPEEDAAGGSSAETCLGSASCQFPQGEDGLGTVEVMPSVFCCAVREGKNPIWRGRGKGYPVWNWVMWTLILILCLQFVLILWFLLQWKEAVTKWSKKRSLQPEPQSSSVGFFGVGRLAAMTTSAQHQLTVGYSKEAEQACR